MSIWVSRLGLDPEVAIIRKSDGSGVSAHSVMGDETTTLTFENKSGRRMEGAEYDRDGAAVEVRSIVDSACRDNIVPYTAAALREVALMVEDKLGEEYTISSTPRFDLSENQLKGAPEDVLEFGCRPDLDAHNLTVKEPMCEVGDLRRWTGGHVHMSRLQVDAADLKGQATVAVLFDYLVAAPMVGILGEKFAENEALRREMYGQPGSFRFDAELEKIEFRTLSGRLLLSPLLLYWVLGATKLLNGQDADELLGKFREAIPAKVVYDAILTHDVERAEEITAQVFKLLPKYVENDNVFSNKVNGLGGTTSNPFFYEQAALLFQFANREGISFEDDMVWNWGLYEDYIPEHHQYWGIGSAMSGDVDELIFPQRAVLDAIVPKDNIIDKPAYTHPTVGGARKYTAQGAENWLA